MNNFLIITFLLTCLQLNGQQSKTYSSMAEALKSPEQVYKLSLGYKQLTEIPKEIKKFPNLTELVLYKNNITEIHNYNSLKNLTHLNLGSNKIETLSDSINVLKKLVTLDLSKNRIKQLPSAFKQLTRLTKLNLEYNKISKLPSSISQLKSLIELKIANNYISEIPESIGELNNIEKIGFSNNNLSYLPRSINKLNQLKRIFLYTNPIPYEKIVELKEKLPNCEVGALTPDEKK